MLIVVPVLASTLVFAEAADAYKLGGKRWPGKPTARIGYHNSAKEHRWAVNEAIRAWNNSGARVRFVAVSKRRAKLLIRTHPQAFDPARVLWIGKRDQAV